MTSVIGRKMYIADDTGNPVAGLRTSTNANTVAPIDITSIDDNGYRTLLSEGGEWALDVNFDGVTKDNKLRAQINQGLDITLADYKLVISNGDSITGDFKLINLEETGATDDAVLFSGQLVLSEDPTIQGKINPANYLFYYNKGVNGANGVNQGSVGGDIVPTGSASFDANGYTVTTSDAYATLNVDDSALLIEGDLTIICRVKLNDLVSGSGSMVAWTDSANAARIAYALQLNLSATPDRTIHTSTTSTTLMQSTSFDTSPNYNTSDTYDIVLTRTAAGDMEIFRDGVSLGQQVGGMPSGNNYTGSRFSFGGGTFNQEGVVGVMSACVVHNTILPQSEINDIISEFI